MRTVTVKGKSAIARMWRRVIIQRPLSWLGLIIRKLVRMHTDVIGLRVLGKLNRFDRRSV
jgi:hypothetical protein